MRRAIKAGRELGFQGPFMSSIFLSLLQSVSQESALRLKKNEDLILR